MSSGTLEAIAKSSKDPKGSTATTLSSEDMAEVAQIVAELKAAFRDRAAFEATFLRLSSADVDKIKVVHIAAGFTGGSVKAKTTKPQALRDIRAKFERTHFNADRIEANSKITPW
jgi:hypothetical protein